MNGIELQDREFITSIREGREPRASVANVLPAYQVMHELEQKLNTQPTLSWNYEKLETRKSQKLVWVV